MHQKMHQVPLEEASRRLALLMEEASQGKEIVKLTQVVPQKQGRRPQLGTATGQVWIAVDFDAPMEDFQMVSANEFAAV